MRRLMNRLGYAFKNDEMLVQALTHSSYAYENKNARVVKQNSFNERLEFLGDAVLEISISAALYNRYPDMPEGDLTKLRAKIVCEASLASVAKQLGLGTYLRLGRGEDNSGGRERDAILADALEAIFGAIFLESGYECVYNVIYGLFSGSIQNAGQNAAFKDYKTILQEKIQKREKEPLCYTIVDQTGPSHDMTFTSEVSHEGRLLGTGIGKSKKEAEQIAAYKALILLKEIRM